MTLIDITQIAQRLGVRREYVRDRLVKSGDFPAPALSLSQRIKRWKEEDVVQWIERSHAQQSR